LISTEKVSQ